MRVTVSVNGVEYTREVEPRLLLVHLLRDELGLTGTHTGCDTSNCGTCVVLMDGTPVKSCTVLAATAERYEITTVEGLERDGVLDPVQQGVHEQHGLQCGFCTSDLGADLPLHGLLDDRALDPLGRRAPRRRRYRRLRATQQRPGAGSSVASSSVLATRPASSARFISQTTSGWRWATAWNGQLRRNVTPASLS
jgi:aerobic carbon-monoxide dehydrogenase small subunit